MRPFWFAGALLCLAGCVAGPALGGELPRQALQDLADTYVSTRAAAESISGVALHVQLAGHPPVDVYSGTDGRADQAPIGRRTLFQIGSNTKSFTAALVLKLEAEGLLDIEQTVGHWLPQYPDWADVKIRTLLDMTAPIPNYSETVPFSKTIAADPNHQFSFDDLIEAVYDQGLPVPSGWFYANTNDVLAAKIIEAASGKSFAEEMAAMLRPLHLKNTFYVDGAYPERVLRGLPAGIYANHDCALYQPTPCSDPVLGPLIGQDVSRMNMSWAGPAGAMVSDPQDLAAWVEALFGGRVIPARQLREMTSMVSVATGKPIADVSADDPRGFGLDLGRGYEAALGGAYWYYQGTTLGFRAVFAYWPQYHLIVTTATNSQPPDNQDQVAATMIGGAFQALQKAGLLP